MMRLRLSVCFVSMLYVNKLISRILLNLEFVVCIGRLLDEFNSDGI
jgi:hypothetical protein